MEASSGVIILTVPGFIKVRKWIRLFPFNPSLNRGDFDHGKTMRPVGWLIEVIPTQLIPTAIEPASCFPA